MATNLLVTGSHGGDDPHVESKHDALMHAAMLGRGGYILKTRNWTMKPTAKDANNITIPAWDLVVEGRQIYIAAPTDVNIQSGSQGQKRRDLIVARYALNSGTGVETVTLEAIKGKPSAATPADPGIETGSIIGGAIVSDLPLCRVNLDGITITSIDTLVNVMQPLEDVWDSLTPSGPTTLLNGGPGGDKKITGVRWGVMRMLTVSLGSKVTASWGKETLTTLPDEWRPKTDVITAMSGRDGQNQTNVALYTDGRVNYENQGGAQSNRGGVVSFCYMAAGQAG